MWSDQPRELRTVYLSPYEVKVADTLNAPLAEYAKHKLHGTLYVFLVFNGWCCADIWDDLVGMEI